MIPWRRGGEWKNFVQLVLFFWAACDLSVLAEKRFDCRIFIFHPECRGSFGGKRSAGTEVQVPHAPHAPIFSDIDIDGANLSSDELELICRKYVFAPVCRGVTSKRSNIAPLYGKSRQPPNYPSTYFPAPLSQNDLGEFAIYKAILDQLLRSETERSPNPVTSRLRLALSQRSAEEHEEPEGESENGFKLSQKERQALRYRGKRDSRALDDALQGFSNFYKRSELGDQLGSFSSFYKKSNRAKRDSVDDLGGFSNFLYKRDALNDLGGFSNFYKKSQRPKRDAVDDLGGFSNFYKRMSPMARFRRDAVDDLGSFSNFYKRDVIDDLGGFTSFFKNSRRGKRFANRHDVLGTFSAFMDPHRYKRGSADLLGSFSSIYNPNMGSFKTRNKRSTIDDSTKVIDSESKSLKSQSGNEGEESENSRRRREVVIPFSFLFSPSNH